MQLLKMSSVGCLALAAVAMAASTGLSQTSGEKLSLTATAVANNNVAAGMGTVYIDVTRWSTDAEREKLVGTLRKDGPSTLLEQLRDMRPTGTIRTPDSIAYDLRYAHEAPTDEGGRRIVIATDRPMGFWEARNRPRTVDYPFTVIQIELDRNGEGKGTLSYATKITADEKVIVLEGFATSPIMLTEVRQRKP